jgi:hypothetical protein
MATPSTEDLETFLRRQDAEDLLTVLLELASDHEAVRARLARMQLADGRAYIVWTDVVAGKPVLRGAIATP